MTANADDRSSEAAAIQRYDADSGSLGQGVSMPANEKFDRTLQLKAERLSVEKIRVAGGEARLLKRVVSERQTIDIPVSHEELVIERHAVTNGAVGGTIGAAQTISIPLSREEVRVGKQTIVTEEIEIGKRAVGGVERVTGSVRHEELVVESEGHPTPRADNER